MPRTYNRLYYECNRNELRQKMRERYEKEKEIRTAFLQENPECIEDFRVQWREKYHTSKANVNRQILQRWVETPDIPEVSKAFLRDSLTRKTYETLTPTMMEALWEMVRPPLIENPPLLQ